MLQLFTSLDAHTLIVLGIALFFVLFYEAINGFHDTANAVATVIYTRALKEKIAVAMAGICNFLGVILGGLSVAYAIVHLLPTDLLFGLDTAHVIAMIFSILFAAIIWNLGTWYFGIPASSSHTLIGSIIGVALANALITNTSVYNALNISKMIQIFLSLIISPFVGLLIAGIMIFILRRYWSGTKKRRRIHMTPDERAKIEGKRKPPFWTRTALILSGAGVSFSHGANDGQKGIGLLMLVLISIAPGSFIVNMNASEYEIAKTRDALHHIESYYITHNDALSKVIGTVPATTAQPTEVDKKHCRPDDIFFSLRHVNQLFSQLESYSQLNPEERTDARRIMLCISESITQIDKSTDISKKDKSNLKRLRKDLMQTVEYAPLWIIIAVALALAIGTMIGWRRVAVTIGEKIGKTSMTYAQGVSAQTTAALAIGVASYTGMPVSTTQVLSSAVAGTMLVDGGGIQNKTIINIALTWILTLPVSILLSSSLFWLALKLI